MEQGESAASFGGKQSQEDQQVADIGFHLKVIEPFSISLHSLGLLRSHHCGRQGKGTGSAPLQSKPRIVETFMLFCLFKWTPFMKERNRVSQKNINILD